MTTDDLWPSSAWTGFDPAPQAESMLELRVFSREGRAHELGELLYALAFHAGSLSRPDMARAAELPMAEIQRTIAEFQAADRVCKANLTARYLRHAA